MRGVVLATLAGVVLVGACSSGSTAVPGIPGTADATRGALLYDKWWTINGGAEPVADHPDYPAGGQQTGSTTWRCKECHGWDYMGAAGAYATGSHFTGIAGVLPAQSDPPQTVFDKIKGGATHDFSGVLSDDDIWDLVAFIKNGTLDMRTFINADKTVNGDEAGGQILFGGVAQCFACHGVDGYLIDLGSGVPDIALANPWETLHKIRWGHPGTAMPSAVEAGLTNQEQADVLAFAQTLLPTGAEAARGGLLYDKWWTINGAPAPTTDHPAYPVVGQQSGSTTWRCKECHGWDYMGAAGAYATGSHFTGIAGVLSAQRDPPQDIFDTIKAGAAHDFSAVLSDDDIWDLVAFVKTGTLDMQQYIDTNNVALGDAAAGQTLYGGTAQCFACHGSDGYTLDFGGGEGVADLAIGNPWETLHKIRWGHPGTAMPSAVVSGLSTAEQVDVLTHAQTLLPAGVDGPRGGLLYDKWWVINGAPAPTTDHPAYPAVGQQSGSTTWRCKECHGWDYMGAAGAYSTGSHFTGIAGVWDARRKGPVALFDAIKSGPNHDFSGVLADADVWDLVAFVKTGTIDMRIHIVNGIAQGNAATGKTLYEGAASCSLCHGVDGKTIDFGGGDGVGDLANANPWETLHKIRWGHPGSAMPSAVVGGFTTQQHADILTHGQTLPTGP